MGLIKIRFAGLPPKVTLEAGEKKTKEKNRERQTTSSKKIPHGLQILWTHCCTRWYVVHPTISWDSSIERFNRRIVWFLRLFELFSVGVSARKRTTKPLGTSQNLVFRFWSWFSGCVSHGTSSTRGSDLPLASKVGLLEALMAEKAPRSAVGSATLAVFWGGVLVAFLFFWEGPQKGVAAFPFGLPLKPFKEGCQLKEI